MNELKPCPFCGESEDVVCGIMCGIMGWFDYVQCQNCGAGINSVHNCECIEAIEKWNRRANNG